MNDLPICLEDAEILRSISNIDSAAAKKSRDGLIANRLKDHSEF